MEKKSLQEIEDFYVRQGLSGENLRQAISKDQEFQQILTSRKVKLSKEYEISAEEDKKYVLSTDQDYEILGIIHQLEKEELSADDRKLVDFIRTQLEDDWRNPILDILGELKNKYNR